MEPLRIIKIISSTKIVINGGSNVNIHEGDLFAIIDKVGSDPIIDPETKEDLGRLNIYKGKVVVTAVYPKMAIASSETRIDRIFTKDVFEPLKTQKPLNVDMDEITGGLASPSNEKIRIGDLVEKI